MSDLREIERAVRYGRDGRDGRDGIDGAPGEPGLPGPRGLTGEKGIDGKDGRDGRDGIDGFDGKEGAPGINGKDGLPGIPGPQGEQGPPGPQGDIGPMPRHEWENTKLRFEIEPGRWGRAVDLQGPAGKPGRVQVVGGGGGGGSGGSGVPGPPGPQGETGPQGEEGPEGPTGPAGPQGDPGATGATGPAGPQGDAGPAGADGADGADGAAGPQGDPGAGVAAGGSAGQILAKVDATDYNTQWIDLAEPAQDAVGAMVDTSLVYVDATPLLQRAALTGAITASAGSNTTALGSFTKAQLDAAISDGTVLYSGDVTQYTDEMAQDAAGAALTDSATIDFTYNDGPNTISAAVIAQMSITSDASGVKLSGDSASPGNSMLYGTDSSGTKGWYAQPAGGPGGGFDYGLAEAISAHTALP